LKVSIDLVQATLRAPFASAHGTVTERELVLLRIEDADGVSGWGEAAPLQSYDGVAVNDVVAALESRRAVLERWNGKLDSRGRGAILGAKGLELQQAVAAVDMAIWDYRGRRAGKPAWQLLGGAPAAAAPVSLNATIGAVDARSAAREAATAAAAGFTCVKVKVGVQGDRERVAAVRESVGPDVAIRIDANGAWTAEEALAALAGLEPYGIELCEEPVHGLDAIRALAGRSRVPVAVDESVSEPQALSQRHADAACLKLARAGGLGGLVGAMQVARATGYSMYLASTLDGPLGIAAALHACAVVPPDRACGLATLGLFERDCEALRPASGRLAVPDGPGLGNGLRDWYIETV